MKKIIAVLIVMTLVFSTACTSLAEGSTTIQLWHRWGGNNEALLNQVCESFEAAYPEYDIEITAKAGEYFELLQSMIADAAAGNELPDIFIGGYAMLNYIATEMTPTPVDQLAPSQEALDALYSRFADGILEVAAYDGQQIGLPYALSNMVMWVNMDIWAEAGLSEEDIPATYEQLTACMEKVAANTNKNGACLATNDNWIDQVLSLSNGGSIIADDMQHISFANDAVVDALTWWQDLYVKGYSPLCNYTEMATMFYAGEVAVYCATIMNEGTFKEHCEFDWQAWPMPTFEGHEKKLPVGGAALISFTADESKYDAVWTLMDYMTDDEAMSIWVGTGYVCPTTAEVPVSEDQKVCYDQLSICSSFLSWPGGSIGLEIDSMWNNARNSILWDKVDVLETLTSLEEECNAMLDNA